MDDLAQKLMDKLKKEDERKQQQREEFEIERRKKWSESPLTECFCELFKHVKSEDWKTLFEILFPEPPSKDLIRNDMLELDKTRRGLVDDWNSVIRTEGRHASYYGYISDMFEYMIANYLAKYLGTELTYLFCHDHDDNRDEIDIDFEYVKSIIKRINYQSWNKVADLIKAANSIELLHEEEDTGGITLGEGY